MNSRAALSYALSPGANLRMDCGRSELSPADVLTALGWAGRQGLVPGFDGLATMLIRCKWARDESLLPALHREIVRFSMWHFGKKRWAVLDRAKATAKETIDLFAAQVIVEFNDDVCHACHGRAVVPNSRGIMGTCPACNGVAREIVSGRARAKALKMGETSMRDVWGERLDFIQQEIHEVERQILRKVRGFIEEL
jgi:hypothetical protein